MDVFVSFLIVLLQDDFLTKVALRVDSDLLQGDCLSYPLEPENRKQLHDLLPVRIRDIGPIVDVEVILDVVQVTE